MIIFEQPDGFSFMIPQTWADLTPDQFYAMMAVDKDDVEKVISIFLGFDFALIKDAHAPYFSEIIYKSLKYFQTVPPDHANL